MMRFRKKPVVIEAIQFTGGNMSDVIAFAHRGLYPAAQWRVELAYDYVLLNTLEGDMRAEVGDWIVRGIEGELYPVKPNIFAATYEPAE